MFVIDGVKLAAFYQSEQVREFNGNDSCRFEQQLQAFDKSVYVRNMRQDIICNNQTGFMSFRT